MEFFQLEGKRDEFRKYLEASGATEVLTTALMKLYQEEERPEDAIGFIRSQLGKDVADPKEVAALKAEIAKLLAEKEKTAMELNIAESLVKKTPSETEAALTLKFTALDADESGNSLLKEYLTEQLFERLKELRTEHRGTLLDNIQSGLAHFDSEIGIFASDQDAYKVFGKLFGPVLEDLHEAEGEGDDQVTQPEVDWGGEEDLSDLDPEGLFIKSIAVTVGRALDGVPFMPVIKPEQIKEAGDKIREQLMAITDDDLKGQIHDLIEVGDEQKAKWIEEGILFPNPDDKFLESAGTYRMWPLARALYLNEKNNIRAWINEEEHLQVTSYDNGGNLKEVFERLTKLMEALSELKFARDPRWGFLAHNLKNIGNTMRIKVKAHIPQLSLPENAEKLETFSEANGIAYKDLGAGLYELTSKKRFGLTEIDTAKSFQKGISELITAEKCLY